MWTVAKHVVEGRKSVFARPAEAASARSATAQIGDERSNTPFELRVDLSELGPVIKLIRRKSKTAQHRHQ
jgi:hypothetical protein